VPIQPLKIELGLLEVAVMGTVPRKLFEAGVTVPAPAGLTDVVSE
jgi:hypothetical protein